jgi:hypothetical protein
MIQQRQNRDVTAGQPARFRPTHHAGYLKPRYLKERESQIVTDLKKPGALKARFDTTAVGYEKVQLFRIMLALNPDSLKGDDVFTKFVNETYHIENEYVMQLNPRNFDAVPEFVIAACTALVDRSAGA